MTGPAGRPPQAQPGEPAITERTFLYQFSRQAEAPDTSTADAAQPADSPIPYTLTAKAETLLGEADALAVACPMSGTTAGGLPRLVHCCLATDRAAAGDGYRLSPANCDHFVAIRTYRRF